MLLVKKAKIEYKVKWALIILLIPIAGAFTYLFLGESEKNV
jgi:drug/metabolite transporter (DMT)-like permease